MTTYTDNFIQDSDTINTKTLDSVFEKLLQNDYQTAIGGKNIPGLWEQKWYNDRDNHELYYGLGDAVWINTESIDDLVRKRESDLYEYSAGNPLLRKQLDELKLNADMSGYYAKLKEFALGQIDKRKGPIYWIGNLTDNAQVRISKKADNNSFPDDNNAWEDFIWNSSIEDVQLSIKLLHNELTENKLSSHNNEYHLGNTDISKQYLTDNYLFKDFSNIPLSSIQKFNSHYWYEQTSNGFDHIKIYQHKKNSNELVRWFKLWDSGYLEHGGIIDITRPVEGDVSNSENNTYTVNLRWTYNKNNFSPSYDYPSEGLIQFYGREEYYKTDNIITQIPESYLGITYRYDVTVTPVCDNLKPYGSLNDGKYDMIDICFMNNDSFSFTFPNKNCKQFCYSVRGYTMRGVSE